MTTAELVDSSRTRHPSLHRARTSLQQLLLRAGRAVIAIGQWDWRGTISGASPVAPLGLDDTGYGVDPELSRNRRMATPSPRAAGRGNGHQHDPAACGRRAGIHGRIPVAWNRALHEGKVLQSDAYRQMITPVGKASDEKYGFGLVMGTLRGRARISHEGGIHGFSTQLIYLPDPDITVVVLQNSDAAVPGEPGVDVLATRLGAFALGEPFPMRHRCRDAAALQAAKACSHAQSTRVCSWSTASSPRSAPMARARVVRSARMSLTRTRDPDHVLRDPTAP